MTEVTLVLSGGGAKATAHLGAVRALREAGLEPTRFVGTSMGAVMATMLGAGLTPEAVFERVRGVRRHDVARVSAILTERAGDLARGKQGPDPPAEKPTTGGS